MKRSRAAGVLLAAALALASPATALAQAPAVQWAQAASDLKADPAIRFGVLPNGMRYAIRKQSIPPGQAALRLWVDAGSLQETDDQRGLAHFLEHMAFNGSEGVKEGEMVRILERLGLAFGADSNASTSYSETQYRLDLPRTDAETVDTALKLLREAASRLTIDGAAVDRERGVVLSEERARGTPGYRVSMAQIDFLLRGQRLPSRSPIGTVEVLKGAPAERIGAYYRAYYRPEKAALVVVGDFDVAAMEAKVVAQFGDWRGVGPAGPDPDLGRVAQRATEARIVVEPGIRPSLQISWVRPPDQTPDTHASRKRDLIRYLGLAVVNRRYSRIARAPNPPFLGAQVYSSDFEHSAEIATLSVSAEPGRWRESMAAAEQEHRRALLHGVLQDELDREIEELRTSLKAAVAGAATRRPSQLAGEILNALSEDEVVTSPEEHLTMYEADVKGLTAATVSAALKETFQGSGPLVFMASSTPIEGGEAGVLAALEGSRRVAVAPPAAAAMVAWPYESFGPSGKVAETRQVADMGATFVRFENGVRLTVKPTAFRDDEVLVRVNVGDGMLGFRSDRQTSTWASGAFVEGGLKKIEAEDVERALTSKVVGVRFGVGEDSFQFSGGTRPEDLPTQLQLLTAYLTEPGWRAAAFERIKTSGKTIHDQYESTDSGVLGRDLSGLLHGGDRRWTFPSREEIAGGRLEDLVAQLTPGLAGPVEVVIVGDVVVADAIKAVAATLGALPARAPPKTVPEAARKVGFPAPRAEPLVLTHKGRADQAVGYMAWPTTDFWSDPKRARDNAILGEVLRLRLLDELREVQGATYSPSVSFTHSQIWTGWGYIAASVEVPPEKLPPFFSDVAKIAADLRAKEPSPDEMERAKKPVLESLQRSRVTNQFWLSELSGAQTDPRRLEFVRNIQTWTEKVTAADVRRAAQTYLVPEKAWKLVVSPQAGAAQRPGDSAAR